SAFPSSTTAGQAQTLVVTALDTRGNVLVDYSGKVHFSSSDLQAGLPADYTFTAADRGKHTFSVTLKSAGTRAITVSDAAPSHTAVQKNIVVNPGPVSRFAIVGFPSTVPSGEVWGLTVAANDAYGNVVTNYAGAVHLSSSDRAAVLPDDNATFW